MYRKVLPALFLIAVTWSIVSIPTKTFAALGAGDAMCAGCNPTDQKDPRYCPKVPCSDSTSGFTTAAGTCLLPNKCNTSATGAGGDMLKSLLQGLLQKLMQPSQSQSSSQPTTQPTTCTTLADGTQQCNSCTNYYQTSNASSTDPCSYYVPNVSNLLNNNVGSSTSDLLLNALGGSTGASLPNVSDLINQTSNNNINQQQQPQPAQPAPAAATSSGSVKTVDLSKNVVRLTSGGINGNIEVTSKGGTIYANSQDLKTNTAVAGFYGGDTFGSQQPKSLVARMCISRPWEGSIVSRIIPTTFFDGLCKWGGFQVGIVASSQGGGVQYIVRKGTTGTSTAATTTNTIAAKVQIWAVPAAVPLGARTSIFWNTQGVSGCTVSSPDGSFNEHALSGGASTVPLTGATTFTISCLSPDNKPVTGYTTVNLSI